MRTIIIVVAIAIALVAGILVYRSGAPSSSAPTADAGTATSTVASDLHTNCEVANATYVYNEDQRVRLAFRRMPPPPGPDLSNGAGGYQIGNMLFAVTIPSFSKEYVFAPVNRIPSGPAYEGYVLRVRPQSGGGAPMEVQLFNSEMHLISAMPRDDSEAPRYIIMPDLMHRLYADHIDLPTGAFRFYRCEHAPAAAAP